MRRALFIVAIGAFVAGLSFVPRSASAWVIADYSFDGDLTSNTGQLPLEPVGYPGVAAAPGVVFGSDLIGGQPATVAQLTKGSALVVRHGAPANGGGTYVNQYSLILDVKLPAVGGWMSLYQTAASYTDATSTFDLSNANDGDWFVNPAAGIGISGSYGGTVVQDSWHRLALTVDNVTGNFTSYIDGVQVQQNVGSVGTDARFSLYGPTTPELYDWFLLFADETGGAAERGAVVVNHFQFRDWAMTGDEIAALGGASASGPIPEPSSIVLAALGIAAVACIRRRFMPAQAKR